MQSLLFVPLLIGVNAFFVVAEYAVVAARPYQIEALRRGGFQRAADAMERIQGRPGDAIGAIQICITMGNLMLGWIGEPAMSALLLRILAPLVALRPTLLEPTATAISFMVVTFLTVVFSELLPKAMTLRFVQWAIVFTALPVAGVQRMVFPLVWIMNATANAATRPLGLGRVQDVEQQRVSLEELQSMIGQARAEGTLSLREQSLLMNALVLGKQRARQIMVHRTKVAYVDVSRSMDENRRVVEARLFSRLPVCEGGMDHVIGVVHSSDFLMAESERADESVLRLLARPAVFVPDTLRVDLLLEAFCQHRTEMLFLVDELGGVVGVVTLQDVVDELIHRE